MWSSPIPSQYYKNAAASATFDSIWVDYDVTDNGVKGMKVHVSFTVYEMKDSSSYVVIFFQDDLGDRLRDNNKSFYSSGGDVAVYQNIKPQYDPAVYKDLEIFMPYSELDLDAGNYSLNMEVNLIFSSGDLIKHLTDLDFHYSKPENSNIPATAANASLEKLWVDYDVTQNGLKGMLIHVKFNLFNMKDVDCDVAIYFEKTSGEKLTTSNTEYRAKSGQVALYKGLKPAYNPVTLYSDIQLFMPYKELNLGTGKFDLTMDADIIYENGDLLKHLEYHDFTFQQ